MITVEMDWRTEGIFREEILVCFLSDQLKGVLLILFSFLTSSFKFYLALYLIQKGLNVFSVQASLMCRVEVQRWRLSMRPTDRSMLWKIQMTIITIIHLQEGSAALCPHPPLVHRPGSLFSLLLLMNQVRHNNTVIQQWETFFYRGPCWLTKCKGRATYWRVESKQQRHSA